MMNAYSVAYGIGAAILVYLAYQVYVRTPRSEAKFYFLLMTISAAIWITAEFIYYTVWGPLSAVFYYVKFLGIATLPYAILMLTLTVPTRSRVMRIRYLPHILFIPPAISILLLVTNPLHHLFFVGLKGVVMVDGHVRYTGIWGPVAEFWHTPYSYFCLIWSFANILLNIRKSRARLDYYFLLSLFLAIVVPVIMNVLILYFRNIYPDPTSLTIVFSAGLLAYVFSRYKLFQLPKNIEVSKDISVPEIERGKSYLVQGDGYSLLKRLAQARPMLVITTRSAEWIRKYTSRDDLPVIWLSEVSSEFSILPERLEFEIEYTAIEFWRQNPGGVVAIDGVGYMSAFNSFDRLLMFLKDMVDVSSNYDGSVVVLSTDLDLMDEDRENNIRALFDERITLTEEVSYGIFRLIDGEMNSARVLCISSENPEKGCGEAERRIWVRRGGDYTPDSMRIEVLYEIEKALEDGYDLMLNKPDGLFIGWKPLKIYTYLKLLADLAVKYQRRVYIRGAPGNQILRKIISMFL